VPYFQKYVALVPDGDIVATLASQLPRTIELLSGLSEAQADFRYAPGNWSVKEVAGHLVDTERVFNYRALAAARGEPAPLPSFDQDLYVSNTNFDGRSLESILDAWKAVRAATVAFFASLDEQAMSRRVTASGNPITARALAWITAGHELHHRRELQERYLAGFQGSAK
jgi:uncharacterized damage-inducible protein DinB